MSKRRRNIPLRLPRVYKQLFAGIVVLASAVIGCMTHQGYFSGEGRLSVPFGTAYDYNDILVKRAVDGDTLVLGSGERVRLIGIDTPEIHDSKKLYRDSQRSGQDIASRSPVSWWKASRCGLSSMWRSATAINVCWRMFI